MIHDTLLLQNAFETSCLFFVMTLPKKLAIFIYLKVTFFKGRQSFYSLVSKLMIFQHHIEGINNKKIGKMKFIFVFTLVKPLFLCVIFIGSLICRTTFILDEIMMSCLHLGFVIGNWSQLRKLRYNRLSGLVYSLIFLFTGRKINCITE